MPRVSAIIPNFNHARYLRQRIDSVLQQTFRDFEMLLMDDASTDGSRSVLEQYAQRNAGDPRIRLLLNDINSGSTFKQWNKGVAAAAGEYIWLAESDDYADPHLLERLVGLLDAHPNVGIAYCESTVIDSDGQTLRTTHDDFWGHGEAGRWTKDFIADGRDECATVLSQQNTIANASAVVFRRSLFEAVGGADESMRLCGDWKLWAMMLLRSDLAHVAEPLNFYRTHSNNVRSSTRTLAGVREAASAIEQIGKVVTIPPAASNAPMSWFADVCINNWLHRDTSTAAELRSVVAQCKRLDPHFNRRLVARAIARSFSVLRRGRFLYWIMQQRKKLGKSLPSNAARP